MRIFSFIVLLLTVSACSKLEFDEQLNLPVIKVTGAEQIDAAGVTLTANVFNTDQVNISRAYFSFFPAGTLFFRDQKRFQREIDITEGANSVRIDRDLVENARYLYRLVLETEAGTIFSATSPFVSQGTVNTPFETITPADRISGSSRLKIVWTFEGIFLTEVSGRPYQKYNLATEDWENSNVTGDINDLRGVATDEFILTARIRDSGPEIFDIFKRSSPSGDRERLGDLPFSFQGVSNFVLEGFSYTVFEDGRFGRFSIDNFTGFEFLDNVPFTIDDEYYAFEILNQAYVFSTGGVTANLGFNGHQFWVYDSETMSWRSLPEFPGTGFRFASATDSEQYIYFGMGLSRRESNSGSNFRVEGDFWRYNIESNAWEFIGWWPFPFEHREVINPTILGGKHRFFHADPENFGAIKELNIIPEKFIELN